MEKNECKRCGYKWWPKNPSIKPKACPDCNNRKWDKEKKDKKAT